MLKIPRPECSRLRGTACKAGSFFTLIALHFYFITEKFYFYCNFYAI